MKKNQLDKAYKDLETAEKWLIELHKAGIVDVYTTIREIQRTKFTIKEKETNFVSIDSCKRCGWKESLEQQSITQSELRYCPSCGFIINLL